MSASLMLFWDAKALMSSCLEIRAQAEVNFVDTGEELICLCYGMQVLVSSKLVKNNTINSFNIDNLDLRPIEQLRPESHHKVQLLCLKISFADWLSINVCAAGRRKRYCLRRGVHCYAHSVFALEGEVHGLGMLAAISD